MVLHSSSRSFSSVFIIFIKNFICCGDQLELNDLPFLLSDVDDVSVDRLSSVKHVILVMSGKGGVGKSTVAVQLSVGLRNAGFKVTQSGLMSVDIVD